MRDDSKARQAGSNAGERADSRSVTAPSEIGTDALLSPGAPPAGELSEATKASSVLAEFQAALARAERLIDAARLEIVMHPDDVTDGVRNEVARYPLVKLHESPICPTGRAYLTRPGEFAG